MLPLLLRTADDKILFLRLSLKKEKKKKKKRDATCISSERSGGFILVRFGAFW